MLPTFVIGLREGLEAALIVGIIAAFLHKQGRRDLLRWVFVGVGAATLLCVAVGVTLDLVSQNLPQKKQEGLETVVGILAVAMVTYMVVWMRRHSRELKAQLEGLAADAIGTAGRRAGLAMVAMAFLAVLREGFETAVFLVAAFNESASGAAAPAGAVLGVAIAVVLGYAIYRGGLRINLSKFFRATGIVLVLVAAGLVVNALHTAHEAGWLDAGQSSTVDLSWLAQPGSVQASLLTGMLGIQPRPVLIELIGWFVFAIPVGMYVAWPPGRALARSVLTRLLAVAGLATAATAIVLAIAAPERPASAPVTSAGWITAAVLSSDGTEIVLRNGADQLTLVRTGTERRDSVKLDVYALTTQGNTENRPKQLDYAAIAQLNGGRLPIGLRTDATGRAAMSYDEHTTVTVVVEPQTLRIVDMTTHRTITAGVESASAGTLVLSRPVLDSSAGLPAATVDRGLAQAREDVDRIDRAELFGSLAWVVGVSGGLLFAVGGGLSLASRRAARLRVALAAAGVAALGLTACSSAASDGASNADSGATNRATVEVTDAHGCLPSRTEFGAGGITFDVTNKDATGVTEVEVLDGARIIGEKENLPPGFSGSFSVTADAGTYTLYCPGASTEKVTLTVTGTASTASGSGADVSALLKSGVTAYATYVDDQVGNLLTAVRALDTALRGTNLAAAQRAYIEARPFYEKIEPVAESFTIGSDSVDADIDARANDVPAAQWRGFHRIEKGLFTDKSLTGLAPVGTRLVDDVTKLQKLTADLSYQPTELANGAQELLDEVAASKITGEEERYSRIDVLDIAFNVEGAQQAFAQLEPALKKIDDTLAATIQDEFTALNKLIDGYRDVSDPSGFVRYTALTAGDKRKLAAAVKAVQEPLSRVASKVAGS